MRHAILSNPMPEHRSSRRPDPVLAQTTDTVVEAQRWAAVSARDRHFDGEFVYAVRSTGIFCRPSCPSRMAKRENVVFYETTGDARAAGYRACLRCRPEGLSIELQRIEAVQAACRRLEASESGIALAELAYEAGLSPHHFHRSFKQVTGLTPKRYFDAVRARRLQAALPLAETVTEAIFDAGFNSSARFYDKGTASLGMAPTVFRQGGTGQRIRYGVESCPLGMIIVAATPQGVCAIEFGDSADMLIKRLRARFPEAEFEPGDPDFRLWLGQVLSYIEQPQGVLDLPLDIQGTVFQRRVWQALREIPSGQTRSYSAVATAIGQPSATRAVAHACASNALAVAIPCHRVVRSNGALSGYRWGVERKAELLRREAEK